MTKREYDTISRREIVGYVLGALIFGSIGIYRFVLNPLPARNTLTCFIDRDGDGFGTGERHDIDLPAGFIFECPERFSSRSDDCNDNDREIHPDAAITCSLP